MAVCIVSAPEVHTLSKPGSEPLKGLPSDPEKPVSEAQGVYLPKVSFSLQRGLSSKRIRSFGDLHQAVVPDIDNLGGGGHGLSSDEESLDGIVPSPLVDGFRGSGSSLLDSVMLAEWEDRAEQGLFRYDVTACPTKPVPGAYGFIAQMNEGRGNKKRPTEFSVDQVCQAYDPKRFNFTKIPQKEILFQVEESKGGVAFEVAAQAGRSPNLVLINVSPIEYGHVLLVPRVMDELPQVVDTQSLLLALHFCRESQNPYFRLCYNSLGAYGTVNHLHFQAYYLAAPFAVERAPTQGLQGFKRRRDVEVAQLMEYPVRGLVFEAGESLTAMAELVGAACKRLQDANIPHNILVVDCGQRLFLFPNNFSAAKAEGRVPEDLLDTQVDPAAFEIAGHLILKRSQDYTAISQAWIWRLLSLASFSEDAFAAFVTLALEGPLQ